VVNFCKIADSKVQMKKPQQQNYIQILLGLIIDNEGQDIPNQKSKVISSQSYHRDFFAKFSEFVGPPTL